MNTTITIKCDIREAQEILYAASKIIRLAEESRGNSEWILDMVSRIKARRKFEPDFKEVWIKGIKKPEPLENKKGGVR